MALNVNEANGSRSPVYIQHAQRTDVHKVITGGSNGLEELCYNTHVVTVIAPTQVNKTSV